MAGTAKKERPHSISLDEYGEPPEPPSIEEIIEDIRKAPLDDIVFKSSTEIAKRSKGSNDSSELLQDEENAIVVPDADKKEELTSKQAYDMSLKFVERGEKLKSLMLMLESQSKKLESLNAKVVKYLDQEEEDD